MREVVGLPPNTQVTIVDYDVEDEDEQYLAPSPIDGQMCRLTKFSPARLLRKVAGVRQI